MDVADRSLIYFLYFVCFWLGYALYEQENENERLFNIATEQQARISRQLELLNIQQTYLEVLQPQLYFDAPRGKESPLHGVPF